MTRAPAAVREAPLRGRMNFRKGRSRISPAVSLRKRCLLMAKERLIVIGGNAAGMSAASQAGRQKPDLEILAFEQSPHMSYSA